MNLKIKNKKPVFAFPFSSKIKEENRYADNCLKSVIFNGIFLLWNTFSIYSHITRKCNYVLIKKRPPIEKKSVNDETPSLTKHNYARPKRFRVLLKTL